MSKKINDVLSWEKFNEDTYNEKKYPPEKIELFNRLIASTENFFVIAAIGAFVPGYVMIITKKLLPSLALIEDDQKVELDWLIKVLSDSISEVYQKKIAMFEHGMCACIGGLDRAHLHIMPISESVDDSLIVNSINKTLIRRRSGISSVEFDGHKFENIHDITEIMNGSEEGTFKIHGKQLNYNDIKNLEVTDWPFSTRKQVLKGGHYVFFKTHSPSSSFLTDKNFQTQLGREIVFEIEKVSNPIITELNKKILEKNTYANIWKWQEVSFKENILQTMHDLILPLEKISKKEKKFSFNVSLRR